MKKKTLFKCVVCGKITAGRIPRHGRHAGDLSLRFPRRHKLLNGEVCPGVFEEAEWVESCYASAKAEEVIRYYARQFGAYRIDEFTKSWNGRGKKAEQYLLKVKQALKK